MGKRGRLLVFFCLFLVILTAFLSIASAEEDRLTIKFHSSGDGKNVSVDLAKYLPTAPEYLHTSVQNVLIVMKESIATIVPKAGWFGDEIITFFVNKSLEEELEKGSVKITNLEPVVEMSFPAAKNFAVSPGQIEFSVVAFDPDNDMLTVDWLVNGRIEKQEQSQGGVISHFIFNQTPAEKRGGILKNEPFDRNATKYIINAVVNDSKNAKVLEWHFNIVNQSCIDLWECSNWSECENGKRYRECKKINPKCEFNTNKPSTEWLDPGCMERELQCETNWTCSGWQECKIDYDAQVVLSDKISNAVKAKQERLCYDKNYCSGGIGMESRDCNQTIPIRTGAVDWCGSRYIEIFNLETGQFISRIKQYIAGESPHLDIDLSLNELSRLDYCWYCYDSAKDYDETGIDCGGSCAECREIKITYSPFDFVSLFSFIIADLLLVGYVIFWVRKKKE